MSMLTPAINTIIYVPQNTRNLFMAHLLISLNRVTKTTAVTTLAQKVSVPTKK
jgi:hypothetical protein